MNKKLVISGVSLAVLALSFAISNPADARDNGFNMAMQMQIVSNLNQQRAAIESRIASAQSSGQISMQQAADLRSQLAQNSAQQGQFQADSILSVAEIQNLQSAMTSIDSALSSSINTYTASAASNVMALNGASCAAPLASNPWGSRFSSWNQNRGQNRGQNWGQNWGQSRLQDVYNLQSTVSNRLESGRSRGRLSANEYSSLKRELDRVNTSIQRLASSNSRFSLSEKSNIVSRLNKLQDRISKELRDRNVAYTPWFNR